MNSVFSVFQSNGSAEPLATLNSSSTTTGSDSIDSVRCTDGDPSSAPPLAMKAPPKPAPAKKITHDSCGYENLRHIRQIESCTKLAGFVDIGDDDPDVTPVSSNSHTVRPSKRCPSPAIAAATTIVAPEPDHGSDTVDFVVRSPQPAGHPIACDALADASVAKIQPEPSSPDVAASNPSSPVSDRAATSDCVLSCPFLSNLHPCTSAQPPKASDKAIMAASTPVPVVPLHAVPIISNGRAGPSESSVKSQNRFQKRISLIGLGGNAMPSVHRRPFGEANSGAANGACGATGATPAVPVAKRTRLSTHQRNLSLDFRSMGILLPPVSQVTNTRINLTQHHRNRSLDSALQRIPEVEVASPSAESENTLCAVSRTPTPSEPAQTADVASSGVVIVRPALAAAASIGSPPLSTATDAPTPSVIAAIVQTSNVRPSSAQSNVDFTVSSCALQSTRSRHPGKYAEPSASTMSNNLVAPECDSKKKREDLTSLGSDDSGIICGSEPDQASLNRIRRSHESIDSGEIDAEGEDCIEILDTTSMDEDYRMIQYDLCLYASADDDKQRHGKIVSDVEKIRNHQRDQKRLSHTPTVCVPINFEDDERDDATTPETPVDDATNGQPDEATTPVKPDEATKPVRPDEQPAKTVDTPVHQIKNEVIFRTFFGATKNAIYRTAQSIIENHEKKNMAKNNRAIEAAAVAASGIDTSASPAIAQPDAAKSPTEFSKKKDFFTLKPSTGKRAMSAASTPETPTPTGAGPDDSGKPTPPVPTASPPTAARSAVAKSLSAFSLGSLRASLPTAEKGRVPGVVKYICKTPDQSDEPAPAVSDASKNSANGLLRFFESPVFNIHFALHYLFYSKEPGVHSFIGNKIFSFNDRDVDLYIPQLILMYMQMDELAEVIDPYLVYRCRRNVDFALQCSWLLEAYNFVADAEQQCTTSDGGAKSHLMLLRELYPPRRERRTLRNAESFRVPRAFSPVRKTHHRSQSDATGLLNVVGPGSAGGCGTAGVRSSPVRLCLGDLSTGRAFDNGCTCFETVRGAVNGLLGQRTVCSCGAPKLQPQRQFMKSLVDIGKKLTPVPTKTEKTSMLRMQLNLINKNLPARVWLPLHSNIPHHVVRITEEKTAVLNSKDKTPYIIYVEVVEVDDIYTSPVMQKLMPSLRHTKSEEHLESTLSISSDSASPVQEHPAESVRPAADRPMAGDATSVAIAVPVIAADSPATATPANRCAVVREWNEHSITDDEIWSHEDDGITSQYLKMQANSERCTGSQMSFDSMDSRDPAPLDATARVFNIGDVRTRHSNNLSSENTRAFSHDPEDPSAAALKEPWHEKVRHIRDSSPYGHLPNWRLLSAIVKCGDDLRQELMATQLLETFKLIWQEENVDVWVRPYKIVCFSNDSGLIEPILNTVSLHQIKKNSNKSLREYFVDEYGQADTDTFRAAQRNFMQSCAAYCLISYLLQVKDRHNGNILLHSDGHLIHIDFGFILSISPKNLGFEQSPFKLTPEFVDVMDGPESPLWIEFQHLLLKALMAARKHMDRVINLVDIMRSSAQLPCFKNGCATTIQNLRYRFHMNLTEQELERKIEQLVQDSLNSLSTKLYDNYQYLTNGIL